MNKIAFSLFLIPLWSFCQTDSGGIRFEHWLNWEQLKLKAQQQHKFIFVDCYATWCKPCKVMDKDVYPNDSLGIFVNDRFISVKLQMDSTKNDSESIRLLYSTARDFQKTYSISSLPTYLFFSADGLAIHKATGSLKVADFITLVTDVLDPDNQIYTLVRNAHLGILGVAEMKGLALKLQALKENELAAQVARYYIVQFLNALTDDEILKTEHLQFLSNFWRVVNSNDRVFHFVSRRSRKIDSVMMNPDFSRSRINDVIVKELVTPEVNLAMQTNDEPQWQKIRNNIAKKYSRDLAEYNVLNSKLVWYFNKKDWNKYLSILLKKWKRYKEEFTRYNWVAANIIACNIYEHTDNKGLLEVALELVEIAIAAENNLDPGLLVDKGVILYKLNHKHEAFTMLTSAIKLTEKNMLNPTKTEAEKKSLRKVIDSYQRVLARMNTGKPLITKEGKWLINN